MSARRIDARALLALPGHAEQASADWLIPNWLAANARTRGGRPAIAGVDRVPMSHEGLSAFVELVGRQLRQTGIGRGDVVLISLPNGPEALTAILSVASVAAAFPIPVDEPLPALEALADLVPIRAVMFDESHPSAARTLALRRGLAALPIRAGRSEPAGVFEMPPLAAAPRAGVATQVDDAAIVVKTAGTTSVPKIIAWSQASLARSTDAAAEWMSLRPEDRSLCVMPLSHLHSIIRSTVPVLRRGGSVTCCPGFDAARILDWLDEHKPTFMTAVPGIYRTMLARAADTAWRRDGCTLRLLVTGSDSVDAETLTLLAETFGVPVQEFYGQSEVTPFLAVSRPGQPAHTGGAIGHAVAPWQLRCFADDGQPVPDGVEGAIGAKGGLINPVLSAADSSRLVDGWYLTGDRGWIDANGALHVAGRIDDRINRGGKKVAPEAVEAVLATHPKVREALVFPIPDELLGERVGALVTLAPRASLDERVLRHFVAARLAEHMVPERIVAVDALPLSAIGKKLRKGIAQHWLPAPEPRAQPRHEPRIGMEQTLVEILSALTQRREIDLEADFESIGIDSFTSLNLILQIEERLGIVLAPADFIGSGSLAALARLLQGRARPEVPPRIVTLHEGHADAPLFLAHDIAGGTGYFHPALGHLDPRQTVYGLHWAASELSGETPTLRDHAASFTAAMREMQPAGPYHLAGYSFAAHLALEIAQQLFDAGEHVAFLGILDDETDLAERRYGIRRDPPAEKTMADQCRHMLHAYVPDSYPGDVWLFQACARPASHLADPYQGWRDVVCGSIHCVDVPGDHYSFLRTDVVGEWVPAFQQALAQAIDLGQKERGNTAARTRRIKRARAHQERRDVSGARAGRDAAKEGNLGAEIAGYRDAIAAPAAQLPYWVYRNLGEALLQARDDEAGIEALREAARREAVPICGLELLARRLVALGRGSEAGAVLQQARTCPKGEEAHGHIALAEVVAMEGDLVAAEAHLRRAQAMAPSALAWHRLGLLLSRLGRGAEALADAADARRQWPGDDSIEAFLGQLDELTAPDIHLLVDGERIEPVARTEISCRFELSRSPLSLVIGSRRCVPSEIQFASSDARCLGIPLARIVLASPYGEVSVLHSHPLLANGFHAAEDGHRWTDGAGELPPALLAVLPETRVVEVHITGRTLQYDPLPPQEP